MGIFSQFLFLSLMAVWFIPLAAFGAKTIHPDEKKALEDIAKTLGKKDWNFDIDPCSNKPNWVTPLIPHIYDNNVTCDCAIAGDNFCHVIWISLKGQNLQGTLPPELSKLRHLQMIDLARNNLTGTIPKEWGSLTNIHKFALLSNRLTGPLPAEIANISSLKLLEVHNNQLSGNLPPELGSLPQIEIMRFSSNNFTGELPATFGKLTTLLEFRIDDNQFTGRIPDYIQNWTKINILMMQGTGLSAPIPSGISLLKNLTDLKISDLNGSEYAPLPQLNSHTLLKTLVLRNCNIKGTLPEYFGTMTKLQLLDLSFNKLSGTIPRSYADMTGANYIFLAGNLLTGQVPAFTKKTNLDVDLSYNNFSISKGSQNENVNLFSTSNLSFTCPKPSKSLFINCGGSQEIVDGKTYEDDSGLGGPARFHAYPTGNWAFSSTGVLPGSKTAEETYSPRNISKLTMVDAGLYTRARVSPISLTYYGYCLQNGDYTVNLHFAEIMIPDDQTYGSLGRRVFDIYLQGKLVQKDFNIAKEAGGVGKKIVKQFNNVVVTSNTLEIRLYWAGKGTQNLPNSSVNGPLISAISIESSGHPVRKTLA